MSSIWPVSLSQQFAEANRSAGALGSTPLQTVSTPCIYAAKWALEVVVVDELGRIIPNHVIELSRETERYRLSSNACGPIRFEGLDAMAHGLSLVGVDGAAWDVQSLNELPPELAASSASPVWGPALPVDLGGGTTKMAHGGGIDKLALQVGHHPMAIWGHPDNGRLMANRQGRNVLEPDVDEVCVPPRRPKVLDVVPGRKYVLVRLGTKARLRLRVELAFEPVYARKYVIELEPDALQLSGVTVDGYIDCEVPTTANFLRLRVEDFPLPGFVVPIELRLETLRPVQVDAGVRQRLRNLGIPCEGTDGPMTGAEALAIKRFQRIVNLDPTGKVDDRLRAALLTIHDRG